MIAFVVVEMDDRLEQQLEFLGRSRAHLVTKDERIGTDRESNSQSPKGAERRLGRPGLVTAELYDVYAGAFRERRLGEAALASQRCQSLAELHERTVAGGRHWNLC